jgi:hypothetical protein
MEAQLNLQADRLLTSIKEWLATVRPALVMPSSGARSTQFVRVHPLPIVNKASR